MEVRLRKLNDVFVIDVIGELDHHSSEKLISLFNKMLESNSDKLVINLDAVHTIDQGGIDTILDIHNSVLKKDVTICFANAHGETGRLLENTNQHTELPLEKTIDSACIRIAAEIYSRSTNGKRI